MWRQFLQQLLQLWGRLGPGMRILAGLVVLAVIGTISWTALRPQTYVPLYSNLSLEELGSVKAKLDADGTQYKLEGNTVLVDSEKFDKLRVDLAVSGLPLANGKGYELFDSNQIGMSPYIQNINHLRAVQGELERTIKMIESVRQVRVHIVQPDPTPFVREQKPVTASVLVTEKHRGSLTQPQVDGIVALVTTGVKGLQRENVTVVDSLSGRVLSRRANEPGSSVSNEQLEHQREVESHLAMKAQEILDRTFGWNKGVVKVSVNMDFQHIKEQSETYSPEGRALVEEKVQSSKATGADKPQGVAGAAPNLAPVQPTSFTTSSGTSTEENIDSKWLVSKSARVTETKKGSIERITVAVMLYDEIPEKNDADPAAPQPKQRVSKDEVSNLMKQAVGFKEGRDQIQVSVVQPPPVDIEPEKPTTPLHIIIQGWGIGAGSVILAMTVLFSVVLYFRTQNRRLEYEAAQKAAMAGEDIRHLETVAEALRVWVETQ